MLKIVYPRRCLHFFIVTILMIYNSVEWKSIFNIHYYFKLVSAKIYMRYIGSIRLVPTYIKHAAIRGMCAKFHEESNTTERLKRATGS